VLPLATAGSFGDLTQVGDVRRYRTAGTRPPVAFLHGPVGPGLELAPQSRLTSGAQREGDQLRLFVPLLAGAGAPTFTFADRRDATWSLRQGRHTLATGHHIIAGEFTVPPGPRSYRLFASTHPGRAWDLSTRVTDRWIFHSRAGESAVPLLTPSYTPPTDLAGSLGPGRTGFRLAFHSSPHSPRVAQVSVEISTNDGRTWNRVRVARTSALTFHVSYHNPAAHGDVRYVSMRLTASDANGNGVQETAIRAYRLR